MSTPDKPMTSDPAPGPREAELLAENATLREELETEVAFRKKLEAELENAVRSRESAKEELRAFIYAASHDLKEPLRAISSYAQLLQRHGLDQADAAEYFRFIFDGVSSATKLIEQSLLLSRAGSSPRRMSVDLAGPLQMAMFKLREVLDKVGGSISFSGLPVVSADEAQFAQVFENLIDNAIKYRGTESLVIQISAEEGEDGHIISVRDNGPGIEPAYHQQIFAPFKRLHGKSIPGAGLGLAMCRKIVEAHEGKIWVESDGKNGASFRFSVPY